MCCDGEKGVAQDLILPVKNGANDWAIRRVMLTFTTTAVAPQGRQRFTKKHTFERCFHERERERADFHLFVSRIPKFLSVKGAGRERGGIYGAWKVRVS